MYFSVKAYSCCFKDYIYSRKAFLLEIAAWQLSINWLIYSNYYSISWVVSSIYCYFAESCYLGSIVGFVNGSFKGEEKIFSMSSTVRIYSTVFWTKAFKSDIILISYPTTSSYSLMTRSSFVNLLFDNLISSSSFPFYCPPTNLLYKAFPYSNAPVPIEMILSSKWLFFWRY